MIKVLQILIISSLCVSVNTFAQIESVGGSIPSKFRAKYLQSRSVPTVKTTQCGTDTLYYGRYNATTHNFVQLQPSQGQTGVGQFFAIDDTVMLTGMKFYAYSVSQSQTVTCKVYYANISKRPAGTPIASQTYNLSTGINLLSWMRQTVMFSSPVMLVNDFVITIETSSTSNLVFACNSWIDSNGFGNHYASIKFSAGWSNSINIGSPPVTFDSDFYFEPILSYKMKARFESGDNSCLGNGQNYDFVNTTSFATNPQLSYEKLDETMDDNFYWDFGDGNRDTVLHGSNFYANTSTYNVKLDGHFNQWVMNGTCADSTSQILQPINLQASFTHSAQDKLISFSDQSSGAIGWNWDFGDGTLGSTQQNPKHLYNNYGIYPVRLAIRNQGCTDTTILVVKVEEESGVGIQQLSDLTFVEISPNPAVDFLRVNTSEAGLKNWVVYNIQGAELMRGSFEGKQLILEIGRLEKGVYFIGLSGANHQTTRRFVKN